MLLSIHPDNPQPRHIQQVVDCLRKGGVIIYPTDTIYGIGCNIFDADAIARIARIKKIDVKKAATGVKLPCISQSEVSNILKATLLKACVTFFSGGRAVQFNRKKH